MKILMVSTYLNQGGGAEKAALGEAYLLRQHGHDVRFLAFEHASGPAPDYSVTANGLTNKTFVREQTFISKLRLLGELFDNREAARQLEHALATERPDIVHLHRVKPFSPSLYPVLAKARVPVVMTLHDHYVTCPSSTRILGNGQACSLGACLPGVALREACVGGSRLQTVVALAEFEYRRRVVGDVRIVDRYLVPSHFLKDWSERSGIPADRLSYLPNFVPLPEQQATGGTWITYVGRLSEEKGLVTLLHAAKRLPDRGFQIVGDGPMAGELKQEAERLGLTNVMWTGSLHGEQLAEAFKRSALLVLPSECFENAPMVIIEAFSYGLAVVGSNRGGIPELVQEQMGRLFEPGNSEDLAEKIVELLETPQIASQMGEAGRVRVRDVFSPTAHYQLLQAAYAGVLGA